MPLSAKHAWMLGSLDARQPSPGRKPGWSAKGGDWLHPEWLTACDMSLALTACEKRAHRKAGGRGRRHEWLEDRRGAADLGHAKAKAA